jgi:hypothetical protein
MSKASIPTYRKMKISETNDSVAKACLHINRKGKTTASMMFREKIIM